MPNNSAEQCELCGLNEHLTGQMCPARSQRLPNRNFLGTAVGADQKQVGEIDRANQQKHQDAGLQQQQGGTYRGDVVGMERRHDGAKAGVGDHFGLGVVSLQVGVLRVDLRLGLIERGAWL